MTADNTHTHVYKTIVCSRSIVRGHPITFSYFVSLSLASFSSSCYSEGGKIWLEATAGTSWSTHGYIYRETAPKNSCDVISTRGELYRVTSSDAADSLPPQLFLSFLNRIPLYLRSSSSISLSPYLSFGLNCWNYYHFRLGIHYSIASTCRLSSNSPFHSNRYLLKKRYIDVRMQILC